jgi:putative MATE family efflux protein
MTFSMLLFALPSFFDGIWLGKLGSEALAAAGLAMSLRITMISPLMALSVSGGAVVARYVGAREQKSADRATLHVALLMVASSGTLGIVGLVFKEPLLYLIGARDEVLSLAVQYVRVIFIGLIAMEMVPSLAGVFNAAGNPKISLRVNIIMASSFIVLARFLVLGAGRFSGFGITGAALAPVISNTLGMLYAFYVLLTGRAAARINVHDLTMDRLMFWRIIKIAMPAFIQRGTPNLAGTILMRFISAYGTASLAAYGAFRRAANLALISCPALARAAGVMVGQNLGAEKPERAERAVHIAVVTILMIASLLILVLFLTARIIMGLFNKETQVIETGVRLVRILGVGQVFFMANMAMESGLSGAADTVSPMVINTITLWLIQLPLIYLLSRVVGLGATGIWIALVISPVVQCIMTTWRFRQGHWKSKRI